MPLKQFLNSRVTKNLARRTLHATQLKMGSNGIFSSELRPKIHKIFHQHCAKENIRLEEINVIGRRTTDFLSDVLKVRLIGLKKLDGCNCNRNLFETYNAGFIVKELPTDPKYVSIYNCDIAFKNETFAYNSILPHLQRYSVDPLPVPNCIHASSDVIILEDLSDQGFAHFDKLNGFSVDVVKGILREMANLHSASLIMHHKDHTNFKRITTLVEEVLYRTDEERRLLETQMKSLDVAIELLGMKPETRHLVDKFRLLRQRSEETQLKLLARKSGPFPVINHGDLWANNVLVKNHHIRFIDFQVMRYTSLAADLNYFLYVNLDPDFRAQHEDEFLRYYLRELQARVEAHDLPVRAELTMDNLVSEMEMYSVFGFVCGLWVLPVFYHSVDPVHKTKEAFQKHTALSIEAVIRAMPPECADRLIRLITEYAKYLR